MSLPDRILRSRIVRALAVIIGISAGIVALLAKIFPDPQVAHWVATVCLAFVGLYLGAVVLEALTRRFASKLDQRTTRIVKEIRNALGNLETQMNQQLIRTATEIKEAIAILQTQLAQWQPGQSEREPKVKTKPEMIDAEETYRHLAQRYGMGYNQLEIHCTITPDGSALVQRKMTLEAYSEIGELDAFLLIPEPQSPGEEARKITAIDISSLNPGWNVSLADTFEALGSLYTVIRISPPLSEGQSIAYQLTEMLPSGLYAIGFTKEELAARKTPYDYFGWNINRPTRKLSLRVWFPEAVKPNVYSGEVRYASAAPGFPSERLQHEEQKRLERPSLIGPEGGRYFLKLDVDYPMIGLIYILRWQPPTEKPKESTKPTG